MTKITSMLKAEDVVAIYSILMIFGHIFVKCKKETDIVKQLSKKPHETLKLIPINIKTSSTDNLVSACAYMRYYQYLQHKRIERHVLGITTIKPSKNKVLKSCLVKAVTPIPNPLNKFLKSCLVKAATQMTNALNLPAYFVYIVLHNLNPALIFSAWIVMERNTIDY